MKPWRESFLFRRLPLLVMLALVGLLLARGAPHEVEMVYDVSARTDGLQSFEVVLSMADGARVRKTMFNKPSDGGWSGRRAHPVRLAPGSYHARFTFDYAKRTDVIDRDFEIGSDTERLVLTP